MEEQDDQWLPSNGVFDLRIYLSPRVALLINEQFKLHNTHSLQGGIEELRLEKGDMVVAIDGVDISRKTVQEITQDILNPKQVFEVLTLRIVKTDYVLAHITNEPGIGKKPVSFEVV